MTKLVAILGSVTPPGRFLKAMNAMIGAAGLRIRRWTPA